MHEREIKISQNVGRAAPRHREVVAAHLRRARATGRCRRRRSARRWPSASPTSPPPRSASWPGQPPLVQVPPRGTWKAVRRRRLPVRRPLARPTAGRPRPGRDRAPLPPRVRPGHGGRRQRLVRAHPAGGRWSRGWTTWWRTRTSAASRSTTSPTASSPTRTPPRRCGCSAPTTTSGSPTPPATGSPSPRSARRGWASTAASPCTLRRRLARGPVAGRRRPGQSSRLLRTLTKREQVRARRGDRPGRRAARALSPSRPATLSPSAACAPAARRRRRRRRSTCAAPRRRAGRRAAPAAANAATSSSVSPPSGPTDDARPARGRHVHGGERRRSPPRAARRRGRRPRPGRRRRSVEASSATSGNHDRRACLAASRAVERQRASDFAARSPFQTATERAAAHGTISATPTSVSTSTASSPRSPFGQRLHDDDGRLGARARPTPSATVTANTRLPVAATCTGDRGAARRR